tara:strand:- start:2181 stop:2780 length:600 start_codon:yes stop_codon:yes gene_type:complete
MYNLMVAAGRLADDVELRHTTKGNPVCNLVVMSTTWNSGRGEQETQPVRCVVFGNQANACAKNIGKGHTVLVVGRFRERDWTDSKGQKRRTGELIANTVQFLARPAAESGLSSKAKDQIAKALDFAAGVAMGSGDEDTIKMVKDAKSAVGNTGTSGSDAPPPPDDSEADAHADREASREADSTTEEPPPTEGSEEPDPF